MSTRHGSNRLDASHLISSHHNTSQHGNITLLTHQVWMRQCNARVNNADAKAVLCISRSRHTRIVALYERNGVRDSLGLRKGGIDDELLRVHIVVELDRENVWIGLPLLEVSERNVEDLRVRPLELRDERVVGGIGRLGQRDVVAIADNHADHVNAELVVLGNNGVLELALGGRGKGDLPASPEGGDAPRPFPLAAV
jgi:hypothetical protein